MARRGRIGLIGAVMAALLTGCIPWFPPFWFPGDEFASVEILVENDTDENWVIGLGSDFPTSFAVGAGDSGLLGSFAPGPSEIVLLDPECNEVDRLEWDGSATIVHITEAGTLSTSDAAIPADASILIEYFECLGGIGAEPKPGVALPGAGGTMLLTTLYGATFSLDVGTATVTQLGEGQTAAGVFEAEHTWSPDGTRYAFTRLGEDGIDSNLYVADADEGSPELLLENAGSPRWSPDGSRIAYLNTDPFSGGYTLAVIDMATGESADLAEDASVASWSPDGTQLAFVTMPELGGIEDPLEIPPAELRIVNADGTGLRTLAMAGSFATGANWSPDGTRLLFTGLPEGAEPSFIEEETVAAVYDLTADEITILAAIDGQLVTEPIWSPDGELAAFTLTGGGMFSSSAAIGVVSSGGGDITRIGETSDAYYSTPTWSADGSWLALVRSDATGFSGEVIAIRPDGTDETLLATGVASINSWRR